MQNAAGGAERRPAAPPPPRPTSAPSSPALKKGAWITPGAPGAKPLQQDTGRLDVGSSGLRTRKGVIQRFYVLESQHSEGGGGGGRGGGCLCQPTHSPHTAQQWEVNTTRPQAPLKRFICFFSALAVSVIGNLQLLCVADGRAHGGGHKQRKAWKY